MSGPGPIIVDVHTHVYPPAYMAMLRARNSVPYIYGPPGGATPRLIILSSDDDPSIPIDQRGRPINSSYSDIAFKPSFMQQHGIDSSVLSLANPWLDFPPPDEAEEWAHKINDDLEATCADVNRSTHSEAPSSQPKPKPLFAFGALPLSAPSPEIIVDELKRLKQLSHMRGVIMDTSGVGNGLDYSHLDLIWEALEETQLMLFLHPALWPST